MIKNLKIYKNAGLIAGGVILASTLSYNLCTNGLNVKPFEHNQYDLHKVTIKEYTKEGITTDSYYGNNIEMDYIIINEPYRNNINNYLRISYKYPIKKLEKEQIDFLIQNIANQDLLLKQEYIIELINKTRFNNSEVSYETSNTLPNENNYEIEYIKVKTDMNSIKTIESEQFDIFATLYYLTMTGLISLTEFVLYVSLKSALKENEKSANKVLKKQ